MKVKTRLYLSSIFSVGFVIILVFVVSFTSNKIAEENREHEFMHDIQQAASELDVVLHEYLMHHETRMEQQWNLRYSSAMEVLREAEEELEKRGKREAEEIELLELIKVNFIALGDLFTQVSVNYEKTQNLIQEGASQKKINVAALLEERLITQLLIASQSIFTNTSKLVEKASADTKAAQELANNLILSLVIVLVITAITTAFLIIRIISKALDKLIEGAEKIGGGNLKYKIDIKSKDEIGQLASVLNIMTSKLKKSYEGLERKIKERTAELEEAKNRSEVLLASIGDGVFAIDRERNIIHFNRAAEELSGYKASEVVGKPYYDVLKFIKEKDRGENVAFIRKALRGEATDMADETVLIRKDGGELPVADSAAPIKDEKGEVIGVIVTFHDGSKERKIQQMRSEFMSLASHELKTPLGIIKSCLAELTDEIAKTLTKEQQELIEIATKTSNKLLTLSQELLEVARLEEGRVKTEVLIVSPIELAEKAITNELLRLFKQNKQKFTFKKPKSLPKIKVDPKFIMVSIKNLLSNASKYTPEKGKIEFEISQEDNRIIFKVTDSGVGIPPAEQFKVFQRFFRASNVTHLEKGTGLGLYMTKLMIEMSGGRIWFESEEKKGSTFYFSLPVFKS